MRKAVLLLWVAALLGGVCAASGATRIRLEVDEPVVVGQEVDLRITALDDSGQVVSGYTGELTIQAAGAVPESFVRPMTASDQGRIVISNAFRFPSAGRHSIQAADALSPASGQCDVRVLPAGDGAALRFAVEIPQATSVQDVWSDVLVLALGPGDQLDTNYNGTVVFQYDGLAEFAVNPAGGFVQGVGRFPNQFKPLAAGQGVLKVCDSVDPAVCGELAVLVAGGGQTYYVRRSGFDVDDGLSPATAWRSIAHAATNVNPGDVVWIGGGNYPERIEISRSGQPGRWIAFLADGGRFTGDEGEVTIESVFDQYAIRGQNAGHVILAGLSLERGSLHPQVQVGMRAMNCEHWALRDVAFGQFEVGVELSDCSEISLQRCGFHCAVGGLKAVDCAGTIEAIGGDFVGGTSGGVQAVNSLRVKVENNRFAGTGSGVVLNGVSTASVRFNEMRGVAIGNGIEISGSPTLVEAAHNRIDGYVIGVLLDGFDGTSKLFHNAVVSNRVGIKIASANSIDVRNNIVAFQSQQGIVYSALDPPGVNNDYNCVYGNAGGNWDGLAPGPHEIEVDPRMDGRYRLLSRGGRWSDGGLVMDAEHSPCIDEGDPAWPFGNEPTPNGGRANMGAWGNTPGASLSVTYGLTVQTAHGQPVPGVGTHDYASGENVYCEMTGSPEAGPSTGARMVCTGAVVSGAHWTEQSSTGVLVRVTNDCVVAWQWQTQYQYRAEAAAGGSVTPMSGWADAGDQSPGLLATAEALHRFDRWTGDVPVGLERDNPLSLPMDRPRVVTAVFYAEAGSVRVILEPESLRDAARWRLLEDNSNWQRSGQTIGGLPPGNYTVRFSDVPGWTTPADLAGIPVIDGGTAIVLERYVAASMSTIPAGAFRMGIVNGEGGHLVKLSEFLLDMREVTIGEYREFCTATGRAMPTLPSWASTPDLPMVNVAWADAAAYAAWVGKRLPTEAEWEYGSRGGLSDALYPWGDAITASRANYGGWVGTPTRAGSYAANGYGLRDMAGNVWEWCADWYASPLTGPATNPVGPATGSARVARGGSYWSSAVSLRCAVRYSYDPSARYVDLGFRCALSPLPQPSLPSSSPTPPRMAAARPRANGSGFAIEWESVEGAVYRVEFAEDMRSGFQPLAEGVAATPPVNVFIDLGPRGASAVYRVVEE